MSLKYQYMPTFKFGIISKEIRRLLMVIGAHEIKNMATIIIRIFII